MAEFFIGNPNSRLLYAGNEFMSRIPELVKHETGPKQCTTKHTPAEWEAIRDEFSGLYNDGFTLPEIMRYFQSLGFDATYVARCLPFLADCRGSERQYKRKIDTWGLGKNIKSSEKDFMVRKEARRLEIGKQTTFWINGRLVDERKLKNARKRILSESWTARSAGKTPANIVYDTPREESQILSNKSSTQQEQKIKGNSSLRNTLANNQSPVALPFPTNPDLVAHNLDEKVDHDSLHYQCHLCCDHRLVRVGDFQLHISTCHFQICTLYAQLYDYVKDGPPSLTENGWIMSRSLAFATNSANIINYSEDFARDNAAYGYWKSSDSEKPFGFEQAFFPGKSTVPICGASDKKFPRSLPNQEDNDLLTQLDPFSSSTPDNDRNLDPIPEATLEELDSDTLNINDFLPLEDLELDWLVVFPEDNSSAEDLVQISGN